MLLNIEVKFFVIEIWAVDGSMMCLSSIVFVYSLEFFDINVITTLTCNIVLLICTPPTCSGQILSGPNLGHG